ncbi:Methyltransferase domain-containing protein [Lentzea fradiae]|uniref:Methyltransferase domain-containing protein n=1 Tax=Lentzea fradiae TaxID=200378 RepID=A0A1G8D778_9PSEU|nr:class I SAM-dependent methyltransferase [Lentzea fradiae]SDH53531.1 Methyltransferase domain-containing protein [Lentzea fradiae]
MTAEVNSEQAAGWNAAGQGWVAAQDIVDLVLRPYEEILVQVARERPRERVLDVGCGTGAVARAIAAATGAHCLGVDIAESMITGAKARGGAEFLLADAQVHPFEKGFDLVVSRFGVMFFADPVAAFRNLADAAAPGADLCFLAWRSAEESPFMSAASQAAAPYLTDMPAPDPNGPGPYSLADPAKTRDVLERAGWGGVELTAVDVVGTMPEEMLEPYLTRLGPVGLALRKAGEADRERILAEVRGVFDPFIGDGVVRMPGGIWKVTASAPL